MAQHGQATLADRLAASAALIDRGDEASAEPALDLQVAIEIAATDLLKVAGAMSDRFIRAGATDVDRSHLARIRKALGSLEAALGIYRVSR